MMLWMVFALAAQAAAPPAPPGADVIVEGQRGRTEHDRATQFVAATGLGTGDVPTTRWIDPFCPRVVGLSEAQQALVEGRVRQIAMDSGAPVGRPGCRPNALIAFTANASAEVTKVVRSLGGLQSRMPPSAKARLLNSRAPARWWYNSEYRSSDGMASLDIQHPALASAVDEQNQGTALYSFGAFVPQTSSSKVSTQQKRALIQSTLIFEVSKQMPPLSALADYAAMISLAEIAPDAAQSGSILDLFGHPAQNPELSDLDRRFLKALYRVSLDRLGHRQRQDVIGAMTQQAAAEEKRGK